VRRVAAIATAGSFLLTSAAFAAEAAKTIPPQIDFGNPLLKSQVVWLGLIFLALYLLLANWALPQVARVLETRAARIKLDLDAAMVAKAAADAAVAELTAATRKAHAEAQAAINTAVEAAKAEAAALAATANDRLNAQLAAAEARIASARAAAVGALRDVALTATTDVVTRLAGFTPDTAVINAAVDHALTARAA
jgi:F-type H+-transporting ATPase subunit b